MSVVRLAAAVGMDKGQISRALAEPVARKLVAHDAILAGAQDRNQRLLEKLSQEELAMPPGYLDGLADTAAQPLATEKGLR